MSKIKDFFIGIRKEAKKTHWPKGKLLLKNSVICVVMLLFFGLFFYGLDVLFAFLRGLVI